MYSIAAAQPLPTASAPQQAVSSPMQPASALKVVAHTPAASAPIPVTVPMTQPVAAITIQLQQAPKHSAWDWSDPALLTPLASIVAVILTVWGTQWATARQIKAQRESTERQLTAARETADRQLIAARETAERQIENSQEEARKERENSAEQARIDRMVESRKNVFSDLIDDLKDAALMIGELPNMDLTDGTTVSRPLAEMGASVNKVWLWGGVTTVYEVRVLQTETNELFFDALLECRAIHRVMNNIKRAEAQVQKLEEEREAITLDIGGFTHELGAHGVPTAASLAKGHEIHAALTRIMQSITNGREELVELHDENTRLRSAYSQFVADRQVALMDRVNTVMKTARKELDVGGDTALLDLQTAEIQPRFQGVLRRVREAVA